MTTNIDPEHWFLEAEFMPRKRFWTQCRVTALIDGKEYMDHLAARLKATTTNDDYYHFTGWRFSPTAQLQPDTCPGETFVDVLTGMRARDVTLRCLAWIQSPLINRDENVDFAAALNGTQATPVILDGRTPSRGSHHQKTSIVKSQGSEWAYVGGIDIALDRWDTQEHNSPSARAAQKELFAGWHDVHCVIEGPAVHGVWMNFKDRWDDRRSPHTIAGLTGGAVPLEISGPAPLPNITNGVDNVQVLRTLPRSDTRLFLPSGEQTIRRARERAIELAEHYIYIEDQYAWPCSLADKLNAAARRGVKVIFVLAHEYDDPKLAAFHNDMRYDEFLDTVREGAAANIFVFHLQQNDGGPDIYVHSKVMIVDDRYAAIGSANINRRSHTTDTELQVAVVGGTPCEAAITTSTGVEQKMVRPFARNLRLRLWKEHLGLAASSTAVDDPIAGLTKWPTANNPQVHHAVWNERPSFAIRSPLLTAALLGGEIGAWFGAAPVGAMAGASLADWISSSVMNLETK